MNEFRILVCGGRDYGRFWNGTEWVTNQQEVDDLFATLNSAFDATTLAKRSFVLIHGGARGADQLSHTWASMRKEPIDVRVYEADWNRHKKAAGPIRNIKMLTEGQPHVIIAFKGGNGTAHMMKIGREAGVPVYEVKEEGKL